MSIAINGSGTITGISQGGLNDNIITKDEMATGGAWAPAGTVLQVVNATYTALSSTSSSTFSDTGLTASITPTSASNKVLVFVNLSGVMKNANNIDGAFKLVRNSTDILAFEGLAAYTATGAVSTGNSNCNYLDSPASASAVTYKVQFKANPNATGIFYINNYDAGTSTSTITLMEIAA